MFQSEKFHNGLSDRKILTSMYYNIYSSEANLFYIILEIYLDI